MIERTRRVVLLIDFDNLQICAARDTPGRDLQLEPVVKLAQRYGTVMLARAYAEWNLQTERLAVYKAGIEPAFAPVLRTESDRSGKSLADTVMVAEGMDVLWTIQPDVLVLATSDKDLIPLVRVARQRGAKVVVVGSDFTAIPLRDMADEHITYKQLVAEGGAREGVPPRPQGAAESGRRTPRDRTKEREAREAREARPAAPPAPPAPAPVPAAAEPVAPVAAAGEVEGQGGRRRRRRGSRRRIDRVSADGLPGEARSGDEGPHAGASGGDGTVVEAPAPPPAAIEQQIGAPAADNRPPGDGEGPSGEVVHVPEPSGAPATDGAAPEGAEADPPARRPRTRRKTTPASRPTA